MDKDRLHTRKLLKVGIKIVTAPHLGDRNGAPLLKAASTAVIISFCSKFRLSGKW